MRTFTASRLAADVLFPDRIEIDDNKIVYYKGAIIGYSSTVVQRASISSVRIDSRILFADLIIETSGGKKIIVEGLLKGEARIAFGMLQ